MDVSQVREKFRLLELELSFNQPPKRPIQFNLTIDAIASRKSVDQRGMKRVSWIFGDGLIRHFNESSSFELDVKDVHMLGYKTTLCSFSLSGGYIVSQATRHQDNSSSPVFETNAEDRQVALRLVWEKAEGMSSAEGSLRRAAASANSQRSALQHLGRLRSVVETALQAREFVDEIPIARTVLRVLVLAHDRLQGQDKLDGLVADLVESMSRILPFIDAAKDRGTLTHLKNSITEMFQLIEEASSFVLRYNGDGVAVKVLKQFTSLSAQDEVDEFRRRFNLVAQDYDRAVALESFDIAHTSEERTLLASLNPIKTARYDADNGCLEGTRTNVLNDLVKCATDKTGGCGIIWGHGMAGLGKTAVASSLCQRLDEAGQLGASFFCKRLDPDLADPGRVLPTLVSRLSAVVKPYGKAVADALRQDPDLSSAPFREQFVGLIKQPLLAMSNVPDKVQTLILDALDECGEPLTRAKLLWSLYETSMLVPWLKVVVFSRPLSDIQLYFDGIVADHITVRDLFTADEALSDVRLLVRSRMGEISRRNNLTADWPGTGRIDQLAQRAKGLFLWVQTVSLFVSGGVDPERRLNLILSGDQTRDAYASLHQLYTLAIRDSIGSGEDNAEIFRTVVGAVAATATRRPLPDVALSVLVRSKVSQAVVCNTIDHLRSLLYRDDQNAGAIRVLHLSFIDFITDSGTTCPVEFHISLNSVNSNLTVACLNIMTDKLHFNMCQLETSSTRNSDIALLPELVGATLPLDLQYASVYWASHLSEANEAAKVGQTKTALHGHVNTFFVNPLAVLFWFEVLSLLGELDAGLAGLQNVVSWVANPNDWCSQYADDAYRFLTAFYEPISQSAPHIYISAVAFAPKTSLVVKGASPYFGNSISIPVGRVRDWSQVLQSWTYAAPVEGLVLLDEGRRIATCGRSGQIEIRDARGGLLINQMTTREGCNVHCLAVTSDGRFLVAGMSDNSVGIWDLDSSTAFCKSLDGHTESVSCVAISSKGNLLASGSDDRTIRLWSLVDHSSVLQPLRGHSGEVWAVAFALGDAELLSGSSDGTIRVWDVSRGLQLHKPIPAHEGGVSAIKILPGGSRFASVGHDSRVRIWDTQSKSSVRDLLDGHFNAVNCAACSFDGKLLATGSKDTTVIIWDMQSFKRVGDPLEGHVNSVTSLAFSNDGARLFSTSDDKTVRVWDLKRVSAEKPMARHLAAVRCVTVARFDDLFASGSADKTVMLWKASTGDSTGKPMRGHTGSVNSIAFSPDAKYLVSASDDASIRVWDVVRCSEVNILQGHSEKVECIAFASNGEYIVSSSADGTICVWDFATRAPVHKLVDEEQKQVGVIALTPDNRFLVSCTNNSSMRLWDLETGNGSDWFWRSEHTMRSAAISPDGAFVAIGSDEAGTISIHDIEQGSTLWEKNNGVGVYCVAFSPDGQYIASGSKEPNEIVVWDLIGGKVGSALTGHTDAVLTVAWSPSGQQLVSGSEDGTIRIWDFASATEVEDFKEPDEENIEGMELQLAMAIHDESQDRGWIKDSGGRLMLYVPADYPRGEPCRAALSIPSDGPSRKVNYDFSKFCYGTSWTNVYDPAPRRNVT